MKYFGVVFLALLVLSLGGCYYINRATAPYTIQIENLSGDAVVVLNGTVVDNKGFIPREGVNRVTIIKNNEPIWVGQWIFDEGSINDFIKELSLDTSIRVNNKGSKGLGIEICMDGSKG